MSTEIDLVGLIFFMEVEESMKEKMVRRLGVGFVKEQDIRKKKLWELMIKMVKDRNKEKQMWLDDEFKDKLEKLQARKKIATGKKVSLGELSRELIRVKSWEQVEKEVLELDKSITKNIMRMNVKFDGSFD